MFEITLHICFIQCSISTFIDVCGENERKTEFFEIRSKPILMCIRIREHSVVYTRAIKSKQCECGVQIRLTSPPFLRTNTHFFHFSPFRYVLHEFMGHFFSIQRFALVQHTKTGTLISVEIFCLI